MFKHNKKVETVPLPLDSPLHNSCVCVHAGVNKIHYFISIDHKFFFNFIAGHHSCLCIVNWPKS